MKQVLGAINRQAEVNYAQFDNKAYFMFEQGGEFNTLRDHEETLH